MLRETKKEKQRKYCYQEIGSELMPSGTDTNWFFWNIQPKDKQVELKEGGGRGRGATYKFISRNKHFILPVEFKEEFIMKKGLAFEVSGKNKQS